MGRRGIVASVDGVEVCIGKSEPFTDAAHSPPTGLSAAVDRLEQAGHTTMLVRAGDRWLGAIGLMDLPRPEASTVITRLAEIGVGNTVMLSGDNQLVTDAVAAEVGVALRSDPFVLRPARQLPHQECGVPAMPPESINARRCHRKRGRLIGPWSRP